MIKNMKIYVFDMGGVITKPSKLDKMYSAALMQCGCNKFKSYFYHSEKTIDVWKGLITDDEFFEYIRNVTGSLKTPTELENLYLLSKGGIYLDTMRFIYELSTSGNIVCLLSNLKRIDYDYLSEVIDISLFDELFLSYELGMVKPNEDIFRHVIDALGTNEFHFFDDSLKNIEVANSLGISAHQTTGKDIVKTISQIRNNRR